MIKPFSENALFEQGSASDDPFFSTGSIASLGEDGSFATPLRDKEQIRLSFAVRNPVKMPGNSSSIYYFNVKNGQWNIPAKAVKDVQGPFSKINFKTLGGTFNVVSSINPPLSIGSMITEDIIGFDCYGNCLASGSLNIRRDVNTDEPSGFVDSSQSSFDIGVPFTVKDGLVELTNDSVFGEGITSIMSKDYPKSIHRNASYDASQDEVFELPIDRPFLIEKVVVDSPFAFGKGWFSDSSLTCLLTTSQTDYIYDSTPIGGYLEGPVGFKFDIRDSGGPGITLALFCQKPYGRGKIRDLICRNLITHVADVAGSFVMFDDSQLAFTQLGGIKRKLPIDSPITVVTGSSSGAGLYFTGSLTSNMTSEISNGVKIYSFFGRRSPTALYRRELYENHLKKKYIPSDFYIKPSDERLLNYNIIVGMDCFGRGMTGFEPSGGSIFGKEYSTIKKSTNGVGDYLNQCYLEDDAERDALMTRFDAAAAIFPGVGPFLVTHDSLGDRTPSPYLVRPGEKLILSISKTRPAYKSYGVKFLGSVGDVNINKGIGNVYTASFYNSFDSIEGHDVQLATGSINITFYGSYVKENKEYIP